MTLRILTIIAELGVLLVAGRPRLDAAELRRAIAPAVAFVRRHALFLGLLGAGVVLRVLTSIAYWPALLSYDSQGFLQNAAHLRPDPVRPIGYPVFLWILQTAHGLAVVPAVQHVLGLAMAGLIYAVLLRLGIRRWVAALATAPVLLDAYQLDIEHYVLAETLFEALLVARVRRPAVAAPAGIAAAAIAGLLFAGVALTRANGFVVIAPALMTVLCLRWGAAPRAPPRWSRRQARGGGMARDPRAAARPTGRHGACWWPSPCHSRPTGCGSTGSTAGSRSPTTTNRS